MGEGDEESERNRENTPTTQQHSAVSNYLGFCLRCSVSQKIPAQSYMVESMSVRGCVCVGVLYHPPCGVIHRYGQQLLTGILNNCLQI